jgi:hypothetical protein
VGAGPAPAGSRTPTHVVKSSHGGKDWMVVGTYTAGLPRELGTFLPTGKETMIDHGALYASKDMYDPYIGLFYGIENHRECLFARQLWIDVQECVKALTSGPFDVDWLEWSSGASTGAGRVQTTRWQ